MVNNIPPGYHFAPTDEELITHFLLKKAKGEPVTVADEVIERDLYGLESPWQIFKNDDPWQQTVPADETKKCIYVYTTLKSLGRTGGGKRKARTIGCGSWHGETGPRDIVKGGSTRVVIGKRQMFTFKPNDKSVEEMMTDHYIMHEFSLAGSSLEKLREQGTTTDNKIVICKITRACSKTLKKDDGKKKDAVIKPTSPLRKRIECCNFADNIEEQMSLEEESSYKTANDSSEKSRTCHALELEDHHPLQIPFDPSIDPFQRIECNDETYNWMDLHEEGEEMFSFNINDNNTMVESGDTNLGMTLEPFTFGTNQELESKLFGEDEDPERITKKARYDDSYISDADSYWRNLMMVHANEKEDEFSFLS